MKQAYGILSAITALLPIVMGAPDLSARAISCGVKGYDTNNEGYGWSRKGTYDACSAACQKDSKNCKSFSFGNNECNLYNVQVAGNLAKDKNSPYVFYDASCVATSPTTSTSTTTKVVTTTTGISSTTKTFTSPTASSTSKTSSLTTITTPKSSTSTLSTTNRSPSSTSTATSPTSQTPSCPVPTWVVSNFVFFNSSQNLDCVGDGSAGNQLCYTGMPPQPEGYGPPDYVDATISDIGSCHQQNPGTTPRRQVGSDVVRCGGSAYQFAFFGNSNSAVSTGHFNIQNPFTCPDGSIWSAPGSLDFQMNCAYDSGRNATCTPSSGTVSVPATQYSCISACK